MGLKIPKTSSDEKIILPLVYGISDVSLGTGQFPFEAYVFAGLGGLYLLGRIQSSQVKRRLSNFETKIVSLSDFPDIPQEEIRNGQQSIRALGFTPLLDYTRVSFNTSRQRHFCSVFTSPDKTTLGTVEYYRNPALSMLLASIIRREDMRRRLGSVFVTYCEDGTRFLTSTLIREDVFQESTKVKCFPALTSLEEQYRYHQEAVKEFTQSRAVEAVRITSLEIYLHWMRIHSEKTSRHVK